MRKSFFLLLVAAVISGCAADFEDATLRMAYPHELVTMDPHAHVETVTGTVLGAVYESLVFFEPGMPMRAGLADRWTTPDDHTWHLHIREGVFFHDGRPLTPTDVVASIERARASTVVGHQLDEIVGVRELADDDRVIEITTKAPAPLLLTRMESVPIVPADFDPEVPVGTGPYRWRVGSVQGPILLERWSKYWAEPPAYREVSIQFVPFDEDLARLLHHKKLDVVASVSSTYVGDHEQREGWRVVASPATATVYLGLNSTVPQLADIRVREAIHLAIDRRRLVSSIFPEGTAMPAMSLVPPEIFGYSPDHRRRLVDRQRARQLVAAAGSAGSTEPLRISLLERDALIGEQLLTVFEDIGLDVEKEILPYEDFYRRMQDESCELFVFMWTFRVADASQFLDTFVRSRDPVRGFGTFNGAALADAEIDDLIEKAVVEPESAVRLAELQRAVAMVGDRFVYLPLLKPSNLALVREGVEVIGQGHPMMRPQDFRPGS